MTNPVKSPCVSVCFLQEDGYCEGCFRTGNEIAKWVQFSEPEKRSVIKQCDKRRKDAGFIL